MANVISVVLLPEILLLGPMVNLSFLTKLHSLLVSTIFLITGSKQEVIIINCDSSVDVFKHKFLRWLMDWLSRCWSWLVKLGSQAFTKRPCGSGESDKLVLHLWIIVLMFSWNNWRSSSNLTSSSLKHSSNEHQFISKRQIQMFSS